MNKNKEINIRREEAMKLFYEYRSRVDTIKKRNKADFYFHNFRQTLLHNLLRDCLNRRATILDIGCAEGNLTLPLAKLARHLTGIDISNDRIKKAKYNAIKNNIKNVSYVQGTANKLNFRDSSFDVVIFAETLEHLPEDQIEESIDEIKRVLKKESLLLIGTPRKREVIDFLVPTVLFKLLFFLIKILSRSKNKKATMGGDLHYLDKKSQDKLKYLTSKCKFKEHIKIFKRRELISLLKKKNFFLVKKSGTPPNCLTLVKYYDILPFLLRVYKSLFKPRESRYLSLFGNSMYLLFKKK